MRGRHTQVISASWEFGNSIAEVSGASNIRFSALSGGSYVPSRGVLTPTIR